MRYLIVLYLTINGFFSWGCCRSPSPQPNRPTEVSGWRQDQIAPGKAICYVVLNEGESSQNNELGMKVIEIVPPNLCAEPNSFSGNPQVVLSLYKVTDGQELCRVTLLSRGYTNLQTDSYCGKNDFFSGITVNAINTKDKWAEFSLIR
jgi:hypothetical protein